MRLMTILFYILPFIQHSRALQWIKKLDPEIVAYEGEKLTLVAELDEDVRVQCYFRGNKVGEYKDKKVTVSLTITKEAMNNKHQQLIHCFNGHEDMMLTTFINYRSTPPKWKVPTEEVAVAIYSDLRTVADYSAAFIPVNISCESDGKEEVKVTFDRVRATIVLINVRKTRTIVCKLSDGGRPVEKIIIVKMLQFIPSTSNLVLSCVSKESGKKIDSEIDGNGKVVIRIKNKECDFVTYSANYEPSRFPHPPAIWVAFHYLEDALVECRGYWPNWKCLKNCANGIAFGELRAHKSCTYGNWEFMLKINNVHEKNQYTNSIQMRIEAVFDPPVWIRAPTSPTSISKDDDLVVSGRVEPVDMYGQLVMHISCKRQSPLPMGLENLQVSHDKKTGYVTLKVNKAQPLHSGIYTCTAASKEGRADTVVEIKVSSYSKPKWKTDFASKILNFGEPLTLTATLSPEDDASLDVKCTPGNFIPIKKAKGIYEITTDRIVWKNEGKYSCTASSNEGKSAEHSFEIKVNEYGKPKWETEFKYQLVLFGDDMEQLATYKPTMDPNLTGKCSKSDSPDFDKLFKFVHGFVTFNIRNATKDVDGEYKCELGSPEGEVTHVFKIEIKTFGTPTISGPDINVFEKKKNELFYLALPIETDSQDKNFQCGCVQLNRKNDNIHLGFKKNSKTLTISLEHAHPEDDGEYECFAKNREGRSAYRFRIVVPNYGAPKWYQEMKSVRFRTGETALIFGQLQDWQEELAVVCKKEGYEVEQECTLKGLQVVMTIREVRMDDDGDYECVASNKAGRSESNFEVKVFEYDKPTWSTGNVDLTVKRYEEVTKIISYEPSLDKSLKIDCQNIPDTIRVTSNLGKFEFKIINAQPEMEKIYKCVATNAEGSSTLEIDVTVVRYEMPKWLVDFPASTQIEEGNAISLYGTLKSLDDPSGKYHWEMPKAGRPFKVWNGTHQHGNVVLYLSQLSIGDTGQYTCTYTTDEGKAISIFNISVREKPTTTSTTTTTTTTTTSTTPTTPAPQTDAQETCPAENFFLHCSDQLFCVPCSCNKTNPIDEDQCLLPNPGCTFKNVADGEQEWISCCHFDCGRISKNDTLECDCKTCSSSGQCLDGAKKGPIKSRPTEGLCVDGMFRSHNGFCTSRCLSSQYPVPGKVEGKCVDCKLKDCNQCALLITNSSEKIESCATCSFNTMKYWNEKRNRYECVHKCPKGTGDLYGICKPCADSLCSECYASATICETCAKNSYKWQDHLEESVKCVEECVDGYYFDSLNWCLPCKEGCRNCSSLKTCDDCKTSYQLDSEDTCISNTSSTDRPYGGCGFTCHMCEDNVCQKCKYFTLEGYFEKKCVYECPHPYRPSKDRICELNSADPNRSPDSSRWISWSDPMSIAKNVAPFALIALYIVGMIGVFVKMIRAIGDAPPVSSSDSSKAIPSESSRMMRFDMASHAELPPSEKIS